MASKEYCTRTSEGLLIYKKEVLHVEQTIFQYNVLYKQNNLYQCKIVQKLPPKLKRLANYKNGKIECNLHYKNKKGCLRHVLLVVLFQFSFQLNRIILVGNILEILRNKVKKRRAAPPFPLDSPSYKEEYTPCKQLNGF